MNVVKELQADLAYVYCPTCRQQGTVNSHLRRDMQTVRCQFGHSWDTSSFRQLLAQHPDMTPESEIVIEQPPPTAIAWKIFVIPETKAALERKFAGRLHVTMGTLCDALASDSVIFIDGNDADKLRAKGLRNGASIVSSIESATQLERERDEAIRKLDQVLGMLRDATGANGEPK